MQQLLRASCCVTPGPVQQFRHTATNGGTVSTVTIFCREGACNVENHTRDNCPNRAAATSPAWLGTPREIADFLLDVDRARDE